MGDMTLADVSQAFANWRKNRQKTGGKIPPDLLRKAAIISETYGSKMVAAELGLNSGRIAIERRNLKREIEKSENEEIFRIKKEPDELHFSRIDSPCPVPALHIDASSRIPATLASIALPGGTVIRLHSDECIHFLLQEIIQKGG